MRLINTKTREMELVVNTKKRSYAILSHTWGDGEVSFQEYHDQSKSPECKEGLAKIDKTCELVAGITRWSASCLPLMNRVYAPRTDKNGRVPLHLATQNSHGDVVALLLAGGSTSKAADRTQRARRGAN
jgi:hypothetical protein